MIFIDSVMLPSYNKLRENGSVRILILEDDNVIAYDLSDIIRESGFSVLGPVDTIQKAENIIIQDKPDLAILDQNIKNESSTTFADKLNKLGIPIIFCTGYDGIKNLPANLANTPLLTKPINPRKTIQTIMQSLNL